MHRSSSGTGLPYYCVCYSSLRIPQSGTASGISPLLVGGTCGGTTLIHVLVQYMMEKLYTYKRRPMPARAIPIDPSLSAVALCRIAMVERLCHGCLPRMEAQCLTCTRHIRKGLLNDTGGRERMTYSFSLLVS